MKRKKTTPKIDNKSILNSHEELAPLAERFSRRLVEQIEEILKSANIALAVPIESRVKSWDSLNAKIGSRGLTIESVTDLTDFIGVRLVLLFSRDVGRCCEAIASTFEVLTTEDTRSRLRDSEFGYHSIHYHARIPATWHNIPTFSAFRELSVEIQIRTAAQHIWAAASHVLQYKHETSVPSQLRRSIHRVSALLETVDLEFERVLEDRDKYQESLESKRSDDENLNVDLLRKVLDDTLPAKNKKPDEDYSMLLSELSTTGLREVGEIRDLILSHLHDVISLDKMIAKALLNGVADGDEVSASVNGMLYGGSRSRASNGIFFSHTGLVREILEKASLR